MSGNQFLHLPKQTLMNGSHEHGDGDIPAGYVAATLEGMNSGPLQIALILAREPHPASGPFVLLRSSPLETVYLGVLLDHAGRNQGWLEIHLQSIPEPPPGLELNNTMLDQQWKKEIERLEAGMEGYLIHTGFEFLPPRPMMVDVLQGAVRYMTAPGSAVPLEICPDDAALTKAGLETYSTTLHRYFWTPGIENSFYQWEMPVAPLAGVQSLQKIAPQFKGVLFNQTGGRMLVNRLLPLTLQEYVELLSAGFKSGKPGERAGGAHGELFERISGYKTKWQGELHVGFAVPSRLPEKLLPEIFHLKILLLGELIRLAASSVARTGKPMFNLSPESFRVGWQRKGFGIPGLWSAEVALVQGGIAEAFEGVEGGPTYFRQQAFTAPTIFQPAPLVAVDSGIARAITIRRMTAGEGGFSLEATLRLAGPAHLSAEDLVCLTVPLFVGTSQRRMQIYGHVTREPGRAAGEYSFRALPQPFDQDIQGALKKSEGSVFNNIPYEIIPMIGTPHDLYSLAVMGALIFLAPDGQRLAEAWDWLQTLCAEISSQGGEGSKPSWRKIVGLFQPASSATSPAGDRFRTLLGPQHIILQEMNADDAMAYIPAELWCELLTILTSMIPGAGSHSICKSFGDFSVTNLAQVFEPALLAIEKLAIKSRSLIVIDWNTNREIAGAIAKLM